MKKCLALGFLVLAFMLCAPGRSAHAAEEEGYRPPLTRGQCGKSVNYTFDENAGILHITGTGPMYDYKYPAAYMDYYDWTGASPFAMRTEIKQIVIGSGVTSIGKCAFIYTPNLKAIQIGKSVKTIEANILDGARRNPAEAGYEEAAWMYRESLAKIYIPASVNQIDPKAFDTAGVKKFVVDGKNKTFSSAGGVLFNKSRTRLIAYPGDGEGSYRMPNTVRTIGRNAFANSRIRKITFSKNLKTIEKRAFKNTRFTKIRLPDSLRSMGYAVFELCDSLKSINTGSGLKKLYFVSEEGNRNLKLTIGKGVKKIRALPAHTRIKVQKGNKYFSARKNILYNKKGTALISFPKGTGKRRNATISKKVKVIKEQAFNPGMCNLKHLTIPETVTRIEGRALDYSDCRTIIFKGKKSLWKKRVKSGAYPRKCDYVIKFKDGYQIPEPVSPYGYFLDGYKTHTGELYLNLGRRYAVSGYELAACETKDFAKRKTLVCICSRNTYRGPILAEAVSWKQAYYRARCYKIVKGKKYYSPWTKPVLIKRK